MPTVPGSSQKRSIPPSDLVEKQIRLSRLSKWLSLFRARDCPLRASRVARAQKDQRFSVPPSSLKEGTYCSTVSTPPKKLYGSYTIYRGVFFGASSFGRFGRRGKTPNLNQGVFTDTPCVTLSHQESVGASPVALERNHQPCSLMRR